MGKVRTQNGEEAGMRRIIDNDYLTMMFRIILGVVFIIASYYKIVDPMSFAKSI